MILPLVERISLVLTLPLFLEILATDLLMDWHVVELRAVEGSMLSVAGLTLHCLVLIYDVFGFVAKEGKVLIILLHFLYLLKERFIV